MSKIIAKQHMKHFENHVATFTDYGNIKILDFQKPGSSTYRIRFLFEEDFYRLHISGDLGHLIATNGRNMCWEDFYHDFAFNPGYFTGKIDCHDRPLYEYDCDLAREQLTRWMKEHGIDDDFTEEHFYDDVEYTIDQIIYDLDRDKGLGESGMKMLLEMFNDDYEAYCFASDLGKQETGILDLYMLAFRLAHDQLVERGEIKAE